MKVAVITPFHSEPLEWLFQCHNSVLQQSHPCDHIMVGDASKRVPPSTAIHVPLPKNVANYGDTPRAVGVVYAAGLGYDAICFLDGDNWLDTHHVADIVKKHVETAAAVVTSERLLVRLDGSIMARCAASDGNQFSDTNCLAVFRSAFPNMVTWGFIHPDLHPIGDQVVWKHILDSGLSRAHTGKASVFYRASSSGYYRDLSEPVPNEVKDAMPPINKAFKSWAAQGVRLPIRWGYRDYRPPQLPAKIQPVDSRSVLYFDPDLYNASVANPSGVNSSSESFLKGYLQHSKSDTWTILVKELAHAQSFQKIAQSKNNLRRTEVISHTNLAALKGKGTLCIPGPNLVGHAWQRAQFGHAEWSLCGLAHATSVASAMDETCSLLTAPVQPWDALICSSKAVKDNTERLLNSQVDYLRKRFGSASCTLPQLPVVPWGIHTQDFVYTVEQKAAARQLLGIAEEALVVLSMATASFEGGAHCLPVYLALERAALNTGKSVVLLECGLHTHDFSAKGYEAAAKMACPSVRVIRLDGRDFDSRKRAWAVADVFCNLSDSFQETHESTTVEAMAAGLPVVVSDWGGHREQVEDGVNGFLLPTVMPVAGLGIDLAFRHAIGRDSFDMHCAHTGNLVAVDVESTAKALERLFSSPELRLNMGAAGRKRARQVYDWATIIPQYENLWGELNALRTKLGGVQKTQYPWPARMDPFHAYASHPSRHLKAEMLIRRTDFDSSVAVSKLKAFHSLDMVSFADGVLPTLDEMIAVLVAADPVPLPAHQLLLNISESRKGLALRSIAYLLKLGLLAVDGHDNLIVSSMV